MASHHSRWALVAQSSSGSTWVNHVLASHPCIASSNEYLMNNATARRLFRQGQPAVSRVLEDVDARNRDALRRRKCPSGTAGGVKLKLAERDIVFGPDGNARAVMEALRLGGWRVLHLDRTQYLDQWLSSSSRRQTGVLHCRTGSCDRGALNSSMRVRCADARYAIERLRLRARATALLFEQPLRGGLPLRRVVYESLVARPAEWEALLRWVSAGAWNSTEACVLADEHEKRLVQTQRQLIANYDTLAACLREAGPMVSTRATTAAAHAPPPPPTPPTPSHPHPTHLRPLTGPPGRPIPPGRRAHPARAALPRPLPRSTRATSTQTEGPPRAGCRATSTGASRSTDLAGGWDGLGRVVFSFSATRGFRDTRFQGWWIRCAPHSNPPGQFRGRAS